MVMNNTSILYKGIFNWKGEVKTLYKHALNKKVAFNLFINELSNIYKISRPYIRNYFSGTNRYKIVNEKVE